jgi:DNA-binding NarL/FixJ family response regulator
VREDHDDGGAWVGATIRVVLVDDHPLVRAGQRLILEAQPDIRVVGEAGGGHEAVRAIERLGVDVVLMDIQMAGGDGLEAARRLAARRVPVLIVTSFDRDDYVREAVAIGVRGFVVKVAPPEELVTAVRAIAAGDAFLSPQVTARVLRILGERGAQPPPAALATLTAREREVLRCVGGGLTNAEVARELGIAETTVRTHVNNVQGKLGLQNRLQVIALASRPGVLDG